MREYVIKNNGDSNNLPCYPPVINLMMLSIGGLVQYTVGHFGIDGLSRQMHIHITMKQ